MRSRASEFDAFSHLCKRLGIGSSMSLCPSGGKPRTSAVLSLAGGTNIRLDSWSIRSYVPGRSPVGHALSGDVLTMTDYVMGSWTYTYDDMNRLASATATAGVDNGLTLGWTYDRYGNRWARSLRWPNYRAERWSHLRANRRCVRPHRVGSAAAGSADAACGPLQLLGSCSWT